jgi:uncharacterized protein (DUF433 family)
MVLLGADSNAKSGRVTRKSAEAGARAELAVRGERRRFGIGGGDILFVMEKTVNPARSVIARNQNILGGTPVFRGTRVPLQLLFESLERGHTLEEFLKGYPTVTREMAIAALEEAQQLLANGT